MTEINIEKTPEQLSDEAVGMFNSIVDNFAEKYGRPASKEEMEYIREKVMLHIFGFYAREEVDEEQEDV
jgi:hypothetical protein